MEVHPVLAHYIVFCARIWEIIHLDIVLDAFADETKAVLPYDNRVDGSLTDKQLAFKC